MPRPPAGMDTLRTRAAYLAVANKGRKWAMPGLVLQAKPWPGTAGPRDGAPLRVGFTASRKVGGAVARNRARRRLRALATLMLPRAARPGRDYVLIARAGTLTRSFGGLQADLVEALRRLRSLRADWPDAGAADAMAPTRQGA